MSIYISISQQHPKSNTINNHKLMAAAIFDILKQKFGSSLQISSIQKLGRELQNIEGLKSQRTRFSTEYLVVRKIVSLLFISFPHKKSVAMRGIRWQ